MKLLLLTLLASASAWRLNCDGSSVCMEAGRNANAIQTIKDVIEKELADPLKFSRISHRTFVSGQPIACVGGGNMAPDRGFICAFYQHITETKNWVDVLTDLQTIIAHGCKNCGSVPTNPENMYISAELTVNYVFTPDCGRVAGEVYGADHDKIWWLCAPGY